MRPSHLAQRPGDDAKIAGHPSASASRDRGMDSESRLDFRGDAAGSQE
jgi:hypothetical protein